MLLDGINGSGRFFLSGTVLNGRYVLRIAVGNMWTTRATLDELWLLIDALSGDDKKKAASPITWTRSPKP